MRAVLLVLSLATIALLAGCTSSGDPTDQQGMPPTVAMTPEAPTNLDAWTARAVAVLWIECPDGDVRWELTDPETRMIGIGLVDEDGRCIGEIPPEPRSWDQTSPPIVTSISETSRYGGPDGQAVWFDVSLPGETSTQEIFLSREPGGAWQVQGEFAPGRLRRESGCVPGL